MFTRPSEWENVGFAKISPRFTAKVVTNLSDQVDARKLIGRYSDQQTGELSKRQLTNEEIFMLRSFDRPTFAKNSLWSVAQSLGL